MEEREYQAIGEIVLPELLEEDARTLLDIWRARHGLLKQGDFAAAIGRSQSQVSKALRRDSPELWAPVAERIKAITGIDLKAAPAAEELK